MGGVQVNVVEGYVARGAGGSTPLFEHDVDAGEILGRDDGGNVDIVVVPGAVVDQLDGGKAVAVEGLARLSPREPEVIKTLGGRTEVERNPDEPAEIVRLRVP